jgi:hypothetical protein
MSQSIIRIRRGLSGGAVPTGLQLGELAVNIADQLLYVGGSLGETIPLTFGGGGSSGGIQSINGCSGGILGSIGITGTSGEIEVTTTCPNIIIGLPNNVSISGDLQVGGNLDILGRLQVDGLIITKTGFQGYTGNADLEPIEGVILDGGVY